MTKKKKTTLAQPLPGPAMLEQAIRSLLMRTR